MGYIAIVAATLIWGLAVHIDRFLVNDENSSPRDNIKALMIFSTLIAGGAMLIIRLIMNGLQMPELDLLPVVLSIGSAFFYLLFTYLELNAFVDNDASVVIAFSQMSPVFSYVVGIIFLGEILTLRQVIGAAIVVIATILITFDFDKQDQKGQHKVRALLLMILALISFVIYSLLIDFANMHGDYNANMIYFQIGTILPGLLLICLKSFRQSFAKKVRRGGTRYLGLNVINEISNSTAVVLRSFAIMFLPLALLDTLDVMGVAFFTLFFGFIGTKLFPKFFDEDMSRTAVIQKVSCIALSLVGIAIIFL